GRGRLGRRWGSPPGGIWASLVLRPDIPASYAPRITQTAAVGVAKTLWGLGIKAHIKWPNDLLIKGRKKICGIIAEADAGGTPVLSKRPSPDTGGYPISSVILGIGLNANFDPTDLSIPDREVATISSELGHDVELPKLLGALLENLDAELSRIRNFTAVLDDWRALNCTLGRLVRAERFGKALEGRAVDVTPEGALLLETPEGVVELFEGEIEHLRQGEM
ncbi:MAG TPA: biotin--[acetyl-CoA-carboxylase] ligase, partial [Rubrobacteraceae bacterium]|nr:biotin--[acetyl-CoA-carboxylase] ligase [Rubrobacteraceae bacterium]